jgi:trehalose 6-phosphate phosphatase
MQTLETNLALDTFFAKLGAGRPAALVVDYDGTLAPFCKDRYSAFPYPGVTPLLFRIMTGGSTRVVLVSGRPATELIPLLGIFPFPEIWGLHGLQRLRPDGQCDTYPLDEPALQLLAQAESWLRHQSLHHLAEFKSGSIAVHWRGYSPREATAIRDRVRRGWVPLVRDKRMALLDFDGGIEIRMVERDKGHAVLSVLAELASDVPLAYLGDDQTDEDAFRALQDCARAITILVRPEWRETHAQAWLRPPEELLAFLMRWLQCCGGAQ